MVCDELQIDRGGKVVATVVSKIMAIHPEGNFIGERRMKEVGIIEHAPKIESGIDAIDSLPDKVTISAEEARRK